MAEDTEEKKRELDEEFKKFLKNQGKSEDWYNGLEVSSDEYKELLKAFDERKKEAPEEEKKSEDKKELTPEERKAAREEQVPTDEFIKFFENVQGKDTFESLYKNGSDAFKSIYESQYEEITGRSPWREKREATFSEIKETDGKENADKQENTDNAHKDEPEWKKMRRKAWEKYAADNKKEFKLLSDDEARGLNMQVGEIPVQYADENHVSMGNGEYAMFLHAIEIEVKAGTDVINFGDIKSEDYKSKLAAACLAKGLKMKNGPEMIDLSLECFKDLDEDTKTKITAYNTEKAAAKEKEKSKDEKKESKELTPDEKKYKEYQEEAKKIKEGYKGKDKKDIPFESMDGVEGKDKYLKYAAYFNAGVKVDRKSIDAFFNMNKEEIKELPEEVRGTLKKHNVKQSEVLYQKVVENVEKEKAGFKDGETPTIDFNTIKNPSQPKLALLYAAYKNAGFEITNAPERFDNIEMGFFPKEAQKPIVERNIEYRKEQLRKDKATDKIKDGQYRDKEGNYQDATFTNADGSKVKKSEIARDGEGKYGKDDKGVWVWKQKEGR